MTADLGEPVFTPLGSYRHLQGEYDPETGILWPDAAGQGSTCGALTQPEGLRVGIILVSKVVITVARAPKAPEAKKP